MCSSTSDKLHATLRMSQSPCISLQNIPVEDANFKVDVTPVVLPKRMIALEGLYQADSPMAPRVIGNKMPFIIIK